MGAKTSLVLIGDGSLAGAGSPDPAAARALAAASVPGYELTPLGETELIEEVRPAHELIYVAIAGDTAALSDRRVADWAAPPAPLLELAAGRRIVRHAMHSVSDAFQLTVWEAGEIVRDLAMSAGSGVTADAGPRYPFEEPFWAGAHPVPAPGYRIPFHPLDLGEQALRAFFGFIIEGRAAPTDIDPFTIRALGFRAVDPSGAEARAEERMRATVARMVAKGPRRLTLDDVLPPQPR
ncbi:hypothetical protein [Actinoplanes sp. L3-i22]|uniref:DUF6928 family protein n=1 Tax=Actinoplanes sp. L3-i22 TaxID=2836373 RepID=UPI001C76EBC8|nr:hypothetical protein [Actinoplanes sp. L3-i22]BCY12496.1 hypothetical protein L3i22_075840 [Actinoplanes sp. L3-i22]